MGVISNKVDITQLQISGGGGGDPTIPGRVTALEAETVQLAEGLALVQTSVNSGAVPMQTGNKIKFGVDGDGNYGYYKAGADTVTPFLTGGGSYDENIGYVSSSNTSTMTLTNVSEIPRRVFIYCVQGITASDTGSTKKFLFLRLGFTTQGVFNGVTYAVRNADKYGITNMETQNYVVTPSYNSETKELTITSNYPSDVDFLVSTATAIRYRSVILYA